ncbi:ATP-dependent DNA helicase RecG [Candidatus Saccharibacteria bacterium]|nr:ATP-dependent DNA helicase RecG [Candidatus Saccharibacteria bacterium]
MDLSQEVTAAKGIGEKTAEKLKKAGIFTLRDLLYLLPRDYENYQNAVKIADLKPGKVIVRGKISGIDTKFTRRRGFSVTTATVSDDSGAVRIVWFNQPYRAKQFDEKHEYYFTGTYDFKNGRYQITSPSAVLAEDVKSTSSELHPIYPSRNGINSVKFCQFFENLKGQFAKIPDLLPDTRPGARADALFKVHFPDDVKEVESARSYLAYEELYELILAAKLMKNESKKLYSEEMPFSLEDTKKLLSSLPFTLTDAQKRATWDILKDLEKPTPMNRLLQGDVGSGKTVVAAISAFQAIRSGFQVALLAPTAILAAQHAEGLDKLLAPLGVRTALLVGSTKYKDLLKRQIEQGNVDLIIGTHALITDDTVFHHLGLCIIDEQHRFGVAQRQKLLSKTARNVVKPADGETKAPHLLAMTATPIPRSLQLTVFGDLDISIINQLPKGRQPIKTKVLKEIEQKSILYPKIREEIKSGHQVYWICRAIEESGAKTADSAAAARGSATSETASVKKQTKKLQEIFPELKIEFLHGRMKPAEKDEIMERFAAGKIDILVSTTVVEVGVNVPNATLMTISDAEGYGLAQLHQLRGRVGRGSAESFCYLISNAETPSRRLQAMEQSTDGFYLAEMDLKIRGPGEIYGSLQHGALDLRIASLTDTKLVARASKSAQAAAEYFSQNPDAMLKYKELFSGISHYQQLTILN